MKQMKNDTVRTRLLQCAVRHFAEKGYAGTNLMEVAAETGVTRGPLYYYFSGKADLYEAAVAQQIEEKREAYSRILVEDKPFLEMLREDYLYCLQDKGLFSQIGSGGKDEPDVTVPFREYSQWLIDRKYLAFSAAQARGEIPKECDLSELITFIYIYYHGVIYTRSLAAAYRGFNQEMLENSVEFFLEVIQKRFLRNALPQGPKEP